MAQQAIGLIETRGLVALVEATDAMLKAANVELAGPMTQVGNALVTFRKQLKKIESMAALDPLKPVFRGQESEFFRERFVIEIDGDKIPLQAQQALVDKLQALFAEHGALDALSVKTEVKPLEGFHSQRHTLFTPEQNIQINALVPIIASVKTKGVA